MRTQNFYLKLTLVLIATAMLSACGASKGTGDNYNSSSRVTVDDINTNNSALRPLAYCNQKTGTQISFGVSTYADGETIALDKVNLKILKIPSYFSQAKNYIEFHRYMVNPAGAKIWAEGRMFFNVYALTDGKLLASHKDYLYWNDLQSAAQYVGATTPDQLFKKIRLVIDLEDKNGEYDVIVAQYYNQEDDSLLSQEDALIPVFDADPTRYAKEKDGQTRHSSLQALHPFKNYVSQGWTPEVYQTKAQEFCSIIYTAK